MYRQMVRIRAFEDKANQLYLSAKMPGLTHMYSGQEAVAVGICEALTDDDKITSTHRGHGHCVAKGADFKQMFCELLGKEEGYCRGKGGSMHIADQSHGNLGANAIVGGSMGIATGAALTAKLAGTGRRGGLLLRGRRHRAGALVRGHEHGRALEAAGDLRLREQRLLRIHQDRRDRRRLAHRAGRGVRDRGAQGRRAGRSGRQRADGSWSRGRARAKGRSSSNSRPIAITATTWATSTANTTAPRTRRRSGRKTATRSSISASGWLRKASCREDDLAGINEEIKADAEAAVAYALEAAVPARVRGGHACLRSSDDAA